MAVVTTCKNCGAVLHVKNSNVPYHDCRDPNPFKYRVPK